MSRSGLLSDEPIGQGSRFVTFKRGKPYDSTITTHRPPDQLLYEVTGKQLDITVAFMVTPRGTVKCMARDPTRVFGAGLVRRPWLHMAHRGARVAAG